MNGQPLDINMIVIEVLKYGFLMLSGWLMKTHTDVRSVKSDMDVAFTKIRELQNGSPKDPPSP